MDCQCQIEESGQDLLACNGSGLWPSACRARLSSDSHAAPTSATSPSDTMCISASEHSPLAS